MPDDNFLQQALALSMVHNAVSGYNFHALLILSGMKLQLNIN